MKYRMSESERRESLNLIRSNLLVACGEEKCPVIGILPVGREDCSETTVDLARSFAAIGRRTLLIGANLRTGTVHPAYAEHPGNLTAAARGEAPAVCRLGDEGPDLLSDGTDAAVAPSDLFGSADFSALVARMREQYDTILIDLPAADRFADPCVVNQVVTGLVLVPRIGATRRAAMASALGKLNSVGARLLGMVAEK